MNTARKIYESDDSGVVHVDLPVGAPRKQVEVVVVWQEIEAERIDEATREKKRAELEALAGALADDPIVRPEQSAPETRLPLDE